MAAPHGNVFDVSRSIVTTQAQSTLILRLRSGERILMRAVEGCDHFISRSSLSSYYERHQRLCKLVYFRHLALRINLESLASQQLRVVGCAARENGH